MRVLSRLLPLALAATLVLAGCSGDDEPSAADRAAPPSVSTATPTPSPTASADSSADPGTDTSAGPPATLTDALLPAEAVTGLNDSWTWVEDETVPAEPDPIGYCDRFDVFTIGATEALHRTYAAPPGSDPAVNRASELLAEFPDETTARQAFSVLRSWHRGCAQRIDPDLRAKVGPLNRVGASSSPAFWYLVTLPEFDMDPGSFSAVGFVRVGTRIAILTMDSGGPDFTYPRGQEPMVGMVRAAAAMMR